MTRRNEIAVEHGDRTAYFYGPTSVLMPAVRVVGCPSQWSHARQALGVPLQCAADVEAQLLADGFRVVARLAMPS